MLSDFRRKKLITRKELGDVELQAVPVSQLHSERHPEGNFLEAKAALYFGSGTIFLKRQISFHSAHLLVPAWPGQSAQFCETAL